MMQSRSEEQTLISPDACAMPCREERREREMGGVWGVRAVSGGGGMQLYHGVCEGGGVVRLAAVASTVSLPLPRAADVARGSQIAMRESRSEERTLISPVALRTKCVCVCVGGCMWGGGEED